MIGNQNDKKMENLLDITNGYNKNERPQDKSENVLDRPVDKVKAGTKQVIKTVKYTDKDIATEYNKEKTKQSRNNTGMEEV